MPKTAKNLYLDPDVIERAEAYSVRHGTNLSTLVSGYLDALTRRVAPTPHGPLVQRLLGAGLPHASAPKKRSHKKPGVVDYRRHLDQKYGHK